MSTDAPIELVPYSADWPARFAVEAALLGSVLAEWLVAAPEHIGSTAVPGLPAKPVIDIMVPVVNLALSRPAIDAAATLGYGYFPYKADEMHWLCKPSPTERTHHLHIVEHGGPIWRDRLAFRDALRSSNELAARYAQLKRDLASRHRSDREAYTEGKTPFVRAVLGRR